MALSCAKFDKKHTAFTTMQVFSHFPAKHITTGEGGILITKI